ncbi:uncharacterized protein LOC134482310 isoform X1 [Rattus norvegicus]|uniref:uncharacterized protein LOC134482310 isoform X1 n=1 Tax=Rattus norvegicus TaxID=10116 RepID=UPI002FD83CED
MEAHNHLSLLCAPLTWDPATTGHLLVQLDFPLLRINKIHEDCATCITEQERPTLEHPESSNCRVICYSDRRLTGIPDSAPTLPSREYSLLAPVFHPVPLLGPPLDTGNIRVSHRSQTPSVLMHWSPAKSGKGPKRRFFECQCEPDTVGLPLSGAPSRAGSLGGLHVCRRFSSGITDSTFCKFPSVTGAVNPLPKTSFLMVTTSFMRSSLTTTSPSKGPTPQWHCTVGWGLK